MYIYDISEVVSVVAIEMRSSSHPAVRLQQSLPSDAELSMKPDEATQKFAIVYICSGDSSRLSS